MPLFPECQRVRVCACVCVRVRVCVCVCAWACECMNACALAFAACLHGDGRNPGEAWGVRSDVK